MQEVKWRGRFSLTFAVGSVEMNIDEHRAIAAAASYLARSADQRGLWSDFRTSAGFSIDWVSGYIACAMSESGVAHDVVTKTASALASRQRRCGGWGFNEDTPGDCDSTSWVVMPLARTSTTFNREAAVSYLLRHQDPQTGGFVTYCPLDGIDKFIGMAAPNWSQPCECVSSAAVRALIALGLAPDRTELARAKKYVALRQLASGLWHSYWWSGDAYATYQSQLAMAAIGLSQNAFTSCATVLLTRQRIDGSWASPAGDGVPCVFETAYALLCLQGRTSSVGNDDTNDAVRRARSWLVKAQRSDGSWPSKPILVIPSPLSCLQSYKLRVDQLGTHVIIRDEHRLFTSASAVLALGTSYPTCVL